MIRKKMGLNLLAALALGLGLGACGAVPPASTDQPAIGGQPSAPAEQVVAPGSTLGAAELAALPPGQRLLVDLSDPAATYTFDPSGGPLDLSRVTVLTARGARLSLEAWLAGHAGGADLSQVFVLRGAGVTVDTVVCKHCICDPGSDTCICTDCKPRVL